MNKNKKPLPLFLLMILLLLVSRSGAAPQEDYKKEYVIVSGGPALIEWERYKDIPHDHWWGNFIRGARNRFEALRNGEADLQDELTWLIYKPAYQRRATRQDKQDLLGYISSVRDKFKLHLVYFKNQEEFLNYLNHGHPRDRVKIVDFEYYGHSNCMCFLFDYSNQIDTGSKVWLHVNDLKKIDRSIFAPHAFIKSWSCHTGEVMSGRWRRVIGQPMIGAVGSTDYSNSTAPGWQPTLSPGGRWKK